MAIRATSSKRLLRRAAGIVPVAIALTIAVAQVLAIIPDSWRRYRVGPVLTGEVWSTDFDIQEAAAVCCRRLYWQRSMPSLGTPVGGSQVTDYYSSHQQVRGKPTWGTLASGTPKHGPSSGVDTAFGWPWPCLWYREAWMHVRFEEAVTTFVAPYPQLEGGWHVDGSALAGGVGQLRALPYYVLPLHFASNTLVYWITLLASVEGQRWLRRRRRLARRQCVECGYSRASLTPGAPCPECSGGTGAITDAASPQCGS